MQSDRLFPGICDFHVHVGERVGGYELRDDFAALDRIAKEKGIAAIGAFVTEEEGISLTDKLRRMQEDARQHFSGHVHWHLTPVTASLDEVYPLLREGCDLKLYTTYKNAGIYSSYERIGLWMQELSDLKPRILVHCEDDAVIAQCSDRHPFQAPFAHTLRRPELAETIAVDKVLNLAVKYHYPVHIVHVSTPGAALLIQQAKQANPLITCETAPHYLLYNEGKLKGENAHRWLCTPPFRSEESRGLLVELLQDGVFDIIASDHCPFTDEDKDRFKDTPDKVPSGISGLDSLFASSYSELSTKGIISLERLLGLCCLSPAELMGLRAERKHTLQRLLG
ncbi:MAG: dihydroorotase family protein [Candidatus Syntrophosphaera sp.]|nr:dihydroorotase family protein [Candidatus Syntrophosphaera sp.]